MYLWNSEQATMYNYTEDEVNIPWVISSGHVLAVWSFHSLFLSFCRRGGKAHQEVLEVRKEKMEGNSFIWTEWPNIAVLQEGHVSRGSQEEYLRHGIIRYTFNEMPVEQLVDEITIPDETLSPGWHTPGFDAFDRSSYEIRGPDGQAFNRLEFVPCFCTLSTTKFA